MDIVNHILCNRDLGKPVNWDETKQGACAPLPIQDWVEPNTRQRFMISYWKPSADELAELVAGKAIILGVHGITHPVVFVGVEA